jgi:hypothetical protein
MDSFAEIGGRLAGLIEKYQEKRKKNCSLDIRDFSL